MENKDISGSGIRVLNVILLESNFKRESSMQQIGDKIQNKINIDVSHNIDGDKITITETISFEQSFENTIQVNAVIKMIGFFERFGDSSVSLDDFAKINGPAIIFPFVREHLATLTLKAGIGQIILPPINFVKKTEEASK